MAAKRVACCERCSAPKPKKGFHVIELYAPHARARMQQTATVCVCGACAARFYREWISKTAEAANG